MRTPPERNAGAVILLLVTSFFLLWILMRSAHQAYEYWFH